MFPFQQNGMLSFQSNDNNEGDQNNENDVQNQIWMEYEAASAGVGGTNTSVDRTKGGRRRRKSAASSSANTTISGNVEDDEQQKKTIHREVERQRRQEMSNLYGSLRSVLPAQYIKGKRSTSDHLEEAVNYIKDMEKNVKELGDRRDQLKASNYEAGGSGSSTSGPGTVVILPRLGGLDIEINVYYEHEGFHLSTALQTILDEGVGIGSYTSTKIDDRLVHNIVCEVSDISRIDLDELQQRLIFLVC